MSHINDLLGVVRGLRLVFEAGLKLQQENSKLIWNNSSVKALIQNCSTNTLTSYKPKPENAKDLVERALVVAHGLRQYAVMHIPNFSAESEKAPEMDKDLKDEIEELNREFNKTFETLKKSQDVKATADQAVGNYVAPLEKILVRSPVDQVVEVQKPEVILPKPKVQVPKPPESSSNVGTSAVPKPVAKKKIRVSVCIPFYCIFCKFFYFSLV